MSPYATASAAAACKERRVALLLVLITDAYSRTLLHYREQIAQQ